MRFARNDKIIDEFSVFSVSSVAQKIGEIGEICGGILLNTLCSTTVESSLQIGPFMQNEANFQKSQLNVNLYNTRDYEDKSNWTLGENEPNSKPIKANVKIGKMNFLQTRIYTDLHRYFRLFSLIRVHPCSSVSNTNSYALDVNFYSTKDYENQGRLRAPGKQTQNKANFKRDDGFSAYYTRDCHAVSISVKPKTCKRRLCKCLTRD